MALMRLFKYSYFLCETTGVDFVCLNVLFILLVIIPVSPSQTAGVQKAFEPPSLFVIVAASSCPGAFRVHSPDV